jgi:hypothetical protein
MKKFSHAVSLLTARQEELSRPEYFELFSTVEEARAALSEAQDELSWHVAQHPCKNAVVRTRAGSPKP